MAKSDSPQLIERAERLRALLANDPNDATTWFGLGRTLFDLGQAGEAIEPLRRATELDPEYTAAHRDLGRALLESGAASDAARVLQRALEVSKQTGDLQTGREVEVFLRRARRALGEERPAADTQQAKAPKPAPTLPSAAVDGPASAEARAAYKRGFQLFVDGRSNDAIAEYRIALESDPGLAIAWNGLSIAHRQKGELDEAIEAGRRLIEINPKDPLSHTNLSILLMQKGMIPEAEEEKAIAMQMQMRSQREG